MGCQTDIAEKIVKQQADYVLAVKQNQAHLNDDIWEAFEQSPDADIHTMIEKSHGRIEKRTCSVMTDMDWVSKKEKWEKLQTIICIQTQRTVIQSGEVQTEQRFYITSLISGAQHCSQIIRQHWNVENKLHRTLDVTFKEDLSTRQAGNAAENFSIITKIAINLLKNNTIKKTSIKKKRLLCALDTEYLIKTVFKEI